MSLRFNINRMAIVERAVCFECGWKSPHSYNIGSDKAEKELDEHKKVCPGAGKEGGDNG